MWRKMLWFVGFGLILVDLSGPIQPVLALVLYFVATCCMIPVCVRVRI